MTARRGTGPNDDPGSTGPITVTDLLAKTGQSPRRTSGRRIAARQAVLRGRRHRVHRHRVRRFFAVLLTFLLALLASAAAYYVGLFFYLDRTVERVDALAVDSPGIMSPQAQDGADNFLIVGARTSGSDVHLSSALIAHLAPDRDGAVLVTLPLTALIDVPACPDGEEPRLADPYGGSLASSYDTSGAGCLVRSVQLMSGLRINHYVQLDLGRLPSMVDALGGVPVCLPAAVTGQMTAPAGSSVLDADQVSSLLEDVEAGQDPTGELTTDRQRLLLASTLREALRVHNLANPVVLTHFLNEAANALILDPATTMGELKDLGDKLDQFTAGDTVQTSVPLAQLGYRPVGTHESYSLIDDAASRGLFSAIISDAALPESGATVPSDALPAEPTGPAGPAAPTDETLTETPAPPAPDPNALTIAPQDITVNVYNGIGTPGLASRAADGLAAQGFAIAAIENQVTGDRNSIVRYAPDQLQAARTVAAAVPSSELQEGTTTGGAIDLVVGSSFDGVIPVVIAAPAPTSEPAPTTTPSTSSLPVEPAVPPARQSC